MTKPAVKTESTDLYNAEANNRFSYKVFDGDAEIDTACIYGPCTDTRYLQWLREFKLKGNVDDMDEESMEATCRLFDDLAIEMENVEFDGEDWRALVPINEKIDGVNNLLAVSVFRPEKQGEGKRRLTATPTETYHTEAYFNGKILRQTHVLKAQSIEWKKKYAQIQSKRFKKEITRGLRRQPKVEFIPQDERLGQLYQDMKVSATGFERDIIPLRFQTAIIQHIFEAELQPEEKK